MSRYELSAGEKVELQAVFGENGDQGFSVGQPPKQSNWDWVLNEWRHGRRVLPGPVPKAVGYEQRAHPKFLDGTPYPPPPISRPEWDVLVAAHGLHPRISAAAEAASLEDDDDNEDED